MNHLKAFKLANDIDKVFSLDPDIKKAIASIDREVFVPPGLQHLAYKLDALPLAANQWISSPLTVAKMTQYLKPQNVDSVLEIGCGSGYQAAILSKLVRRVFTIERIEKLLKEAKQRFSKLELYNIHTRHSDGMLGWKEFAPYERILFSAAATEIPQTIFDQLQEGGILVAPLQTAKGQHIMRYTKRNGLIQKECLEECLFVEVKKGIS